MKAMMGKYRIHGQSVLFYPGAVGLFCFWGFILVVCFLFWAVCVLIGRIVFCCGSLCFVLVICLVLFIFCSVF